MPKGPRLSARLIGPGLGTLVIAVVLALAFTTETYRVLELKLLDLRFDMRRPLPQSTRILHIDIDDSSINSMGRWPWPRDRHAHLIGLLDELGAAAIAFDVTFESPSKSGVTAETLESIMKLPDARIGSALRNAIPRDDAVMAEAVRDSARVILPCRLIPRRKMTPEDERTDGRIRAALRQSFNDRELELIEKLKLPREIVEQRLMSQKEYVACDVAWEIAGEGIDKLTVEALGARLIPDFNPDHQSAEKDIIVRAVDHCRSVRLIYEKSSKRIPEGFDTSAFRHVENIRPPLFMFARGTVAFGAPNALPDREDGVVRRVPLLFVSGNRLIPHLSLQYACWALGTSIEELEVEPGRHVIIHPKNDLAGGREPIIVPVDGYCRTVVNWAGSVETPWHDLFEHLPYGEIGELSSLRLDVIHNDHRLRRYDDSIFGSQRTGFLEELHALEFRDDLSAKEAVRLRELRALRTRFEDDALDKFKRNLKGVTDEAFRGLDEESRLLVQLMRVGQKEIPEIRRERPRLLAMAAALRDRLKPLIEDKLCIVGMTASGSTDLKPTPVHPSFPGVGVHSAIMNSIFQRRFVREASRSGTLFGRTTTPGSARGWVNIMLIVVVGMGVSVIASYFVTRWAAIGSFLTVAAYVGLSHLMFTWWGYAVTLAGPLIAGFLSYAVITAYRQLTEERQKRQVRNAFQHYLSPSVVAEVLKDPEALRLGGERKDLTVFFSDVAGFTPIAESLEPEELVTLLNDYLSEMSEVILESNGYINKYEGDAIMAVFGAPLDDARHSHAACSVALESQRRLARFRDRLKAAGRPPIHARIGLNSGIMIVGNMGSRKLFDYTVMGDNVNVGARLETASKPFGTEIIIGENTWNEVADEFATRRLGLIHVKGRTQPVGAYELLGEKDNVPEAVAKVLPRYNEGLAAYADQRWADALALFDECLKTHPDDGPSKAYLQRCRELATDRPIEGWDGSFQL